MGKKDNVTKTYMKNSAVFADAFNFYVYNGEQVLKPEDLKELDTAESVIIFDTAGSKQISESKQKYRDVLKSAVFMRNNKTVYAVFGIENQSEVHYAMPVRCFVYDAMQYDRQVHNSPNHSNNKKNGSTSSNTTYLSGFSKEDRLTPVITLVVYFKSVAKRICGLRACTQGHIDTWQPTCMSNVGQ